MFRGDTGVLIRAKNGVVIGYDRTGLILNLSDRTVDDLRARIGAPAAAYVDPRVLGDIDAWNVVEAEGWYLFDAMLPPYPHPRRFRRRVTGGDILADAPGPVLAMLSLGGARRAGANPGRSAFPAHVLAPGDDIGAVGLFGIEAASLCDTLQQVPEQSIDALAGAALLRRRQAEGRALPLVVTRAESDASASIAELTEGPAMANLLTALDTAMSAAATMGRELRFASLALDFAAEDVISPPEAYVAGVYRLVGKIQAAAEARGLRPPPILLRGDETGARLCEQHQLALFPAGHDIRITAPGRAFAWDAAQRPTEAARRAMAETEAAAVAAHLDQTPWACPVLLLAEREGPRRIRITCAADTPLDLAEGPHGFAIEGADIADVALSEDDDRAVIVSLTDDLPDATLTMTYGAATRGALRDAFAEDTPEGPLHRWALPAQIQVF